MNIVITHGSGDPSHAIIWLHGLGASASDFPPIVPHLGLNPKPGIRFVFPQAPDRPITINGGFVMPGWYDIRGTSIEEKQDRQGVEASRALVENLIDEQIASGIPAQNIILAGFSQGGAISYYTALRSEHRLAGVLALSTYLLFAEETGKEQKPANRETPIFASHGTVDNMVPVAMGEQAVHTLKGLGYSVRWETYPMAHEVSIEQIRAIGDWINARFN